MPPSQIFTNADKAHAARALSKLGLDDCFEGVICFETLNPPTKQDGVDDKDRSIADSNTDDGIDSRSDTVKCIDKFSLAPQGPRILCKPSLESMQAAIRIANIDPRRTVSHRIDVSG